MEGTLHRAPLDLGELLRRVAYGRHRDSGAAGVMLAVDGPEEPCLVNGDDQLLARAVENVLDNALRYTPRGGRIEIRWRSLRDRTEFTIADTGPGIPPADLPHIFEAMYRAEPSRNRETGGTGLGLAIARRILRAHGGDLQAANRPDGGAELTGSVPLLAEECRPDVSVSHASP
jgi:signal transduction histidine kinase